MCGQYASEQNACKDCKSGQNASQFWPRVDKILVTCIFAITQDNTLALHLQNTWLQELKCPFCVTFDFGSARVFSTASFETYFYYHQYIWITATDYFMYFSPFYPTSIKNYSSINNLLFHNFCFTN